MKKRGYVMKKLSIVLSICLLALVTACDAKNDYNKPKTEVRTMIINLSLNSEAIKKIRGHIVSTW